jgi:hypothetical protein
VSDHPVLLSGMQWLTANANRNYPLEDYATKRDASGNELPDGLLADLHVWFPEELGRCVFISSVTISPLLVSLTLAVHAVRPFQDSAAQAFIPLAAVTVPTPLQPGLNYPLRPFAPGVGGWLTFGPEAGGLPPGSYRFDDPVQTAILPHLARMYPITGVLSLGRLGYETKLTGVVTIKSNSPETLVIEKRQETILGVTRDALVFRLNEEESGHDIFKRFVGPCGGVPESNTCKFPQISSIGGAVPDCNGVIKLYINEIWQEPDGGPDLVLSYANTANNGSEPAGSGQGHTVNLDYNRGLGDICKKAPDQFAQNSDDSCDNPCDDTGFEQPSPIVRNICQSFQTGWRPEVGYVGGTAFLYLGTPFTIDVSQMDEIIFRGTSDDLFMLIPGGSTIDQSPPPASYVRGSGAGTPVTFHIPPAAIIFHDTYGWFKHKAFMTGTLFVPSSVQKTITDGSNFYTIVAGNSSNDGTGHVPDLNTTGSNFRIVEFGVSFTIGELEALGFVDNGILYARIAHIASGSGFGNLELVCPAPHNQDADPCPEDPTDGLNTTGSSSSSSSSSSSGG